MIVTAVACKEPPVAATPDDPEEQEVNYHFFYTSDESGKLEVWKLEGSVRTQLTSSADYDNWWSRVSPGRQTVLFYRSTAGRDLNDFSSASLWSMNIDGGNQKELIANGANNWEMQGFASWSHNGELIVMIATDKTSGYQHIYTCDPDGKNIEVISPDDSADYYEPVFAMGDGSVFCTRIPLGEDPEKSDFEIYEIDLNTGEETRLTFNDYQDHSPSVSPDGGKLAYTSNVDPNYLGTLGKWVLKELDLQSLKERTILEDDNLNILPVYALDGESIFFTRANILNSTTSVCRLQLNDGSVSRLLDKNFSSLNVDPF